MNNMSKVVEMKKIINGKLYDTSKAKLIKVNNQMKDSASHSSYYEEFYETEKCAKFMAFWGGANTKYGVEITGGKDESKGIIVDGEKIKELSFVDSTFDDDFIDMTLKKNSKIKVEEFEKIIEHYHELTFARGYILDELLKDSKGDYHIFKTDGMGNEDLLKISIEDAKVFMELFGTVEQYISEFGEVEEA